MCPTKHVLEEGYSQNCAAKFCKSNPGDEQEQRSRYKFLGAELPSIRPVIIFSLGRYAHIPTTGWKVSLPLYVEVFVDGTGVSELCIPFRLVAIGAPLAQCLWCPVHQKSTNMQSPVKSPTGLAAYLVVCHPLR